ncbi:MAG: hypothetical protein IJJ04_01080 [Clostridia bacterium]|nr:hypothetical protein [Clostridia bacterium]
MILKTNNIQQIILINMFLIILWHLIVLFVCRNIKSKSFFSPKKFIYVPKKWEENGNFYVKKLKIKKWKDKLPQYVAKDGFSKKNLQSLTKLSPEYIERFILETCRAEWNHIMCCMYFVISFIINSFYYGIIFSVIPVVANVPFIFIQRYNRIRLLKLKHRAKANFTKEFLNPT